MNESVFKEILGEAVMLGSNAADAAPEHEFSAKHTRAMKRILSRFERNSRRLRKNTEIEYKSKPLLSLKKRVLIAAVVIILMALFAGWRRVAEGLYKLDSGSQRGFTVNENLLPKTKTQAVPTHKITDAQINYLKSEFDLDYLSARGISSEEYGKFILELVEMNVFSLDDARNLFGVMPFNASHKGYLYKEDAGYVNPFGGENYLGEDALQSGLAVEYLKARYGGLSENEYVEMAEELVNQRRECLSVIEEIFERSTQKTQSSPEVKNPAVTIKNIEY